MSLVLDVVQQIVLQKVVDLTCEAALEVLRRCAGLKEKREIERSKPEPPVKPVPLPPPKPSCQAVTAPEISRAFRHVERDFPRTNCGSIDPPQCSCMRVCRDSYFS